MSLGKFETGLGLYVCTLGSRPAYTPGTNAGRTVYVSDAPAGSRVHVWNGTDWESSPVWSAWQVVTATGNPQVFTIPTALVPSSVIVADGGGLSFGYTVNPAGTQLTLDYTPELPAEIRVKGLIL